LVKSFFGEILGTKSPPGGEPATSPLFGRYRLLALVSMAKFKTVGLSYGALRKECLDAVRQWPGCDSVAGIQSIRENTPDGFSVRVTFYGNADEKNRRSCDQVRSA